MRSMKLTGLFALAVLLALTAPAARAEGDPPQTATGTAQPQNATTTAQPHAGERHPAARKLLARTQTLLVQAWRRCGRGGQQKDELRDAWIRQHAAWRALGEGHPAVAARLS